MNENNYKDEIIASRTGSLGSSDADIVASVGRSGELTGATARKRIAIMLGLAERVDIKTADMELGDVLEMQIFGIVKEQFEPKGYEVRSNPLYERKQAICGFRVISHIDFEIENENEIIWFENKASMYDTPEVMEKYAAQLQWHYMLLREKANNEGKLFRLYLSHYRTKVTAEFDAANLRIVKVSPDKMLERYITKGLEVIENSLDGFEWVESSEVSIFETTKELANNAKDVAEKLRILDEAEKRIKAFKDELKSYIEAHGGVSIKADGLFAVTYTAAHTSPKFDTTRFKKDHPDLYEEYLKQSNVSSSISIKLK